MNFSLTEQAEQKFITEITYGYFIYMILFHTSISFRGTKEVEKGVTPSLGASGPNDGTIWAEKITAKNASVSCSYEMWTLRALAKGSLTDR